MQAFAFSSRKADRRLRCRLPHKKSKPKRPGFTHANDACGAATVPNGDPYMSLSPEAKRAELRNAALEYHEFTPQDCHCPHQTTDQPARPALAYSPVWLRRGGNRQRPQRRSLHRARQPWRGHQRHRRAGSGRHWPLAGKPRWKVGVLFKKGTWRHRNQRGPDKLVKSSPPEPRRRHQPKTSRRLTAMWRSCASAEDPCSTTTSTTPPSWWGQPFSTA